MPRVYRIPYTGTLTAAGCDADLVVIQPASNKPCRFVGWVVSQVSEVGDAAEEDVQITVRHMTATVTVTGGTAVTPVPNHPGTDTAAGLTATCNCTTVATTSGASTTMEQLGWNERNTPWERWIPEELRPVAINGEALVVRMETTLADDMTGTLTFFVEELG